MKKLNIAQIAPPFIPVPPTHYGGTESVISSITEELVKRGHNVTLYAAGTSQTSASLVSPFPQPLDQTATDALFSPLAHKLFWMHSLPYMQHVSRALRDAHMFDIIHDHTHYMSVFYRDFIKTPIVSTYHGSLQWASQSPIEKMILETYKAHNWIAISRAQQHYSEVDLNIVSVVHHGIQPNAFSFSENVNKNFVWLGRITKQKGIEDAITATRQTETELVISGVVNDRDKEFFETSVKPAFTDKRITYSGPADHTQKIVLLGRAKALLYPLLWEEPFGLVMVETMACGTPVIAYARGAAPEIIEDGVTGFLVNSSPQDIRGDFVVKKTGIAGLCEAITRINNLSDHDYRNMRLRARKRVEKHFTVEKMVDTYEAVYSNILNI